MSAQSPAGRQPILAANWKMHFQRREAKTYCRELSGRLGNSGVEVLIFPSPTLLTTVAQHLAGSGASCGGQDLHPEAKGAYTGDVSGPQLTDAGASWVLCGHSERRRDHGENDELVANKALAACEHGLTPLVCLGESAEQRRAGQTLRVLDQQLQAVLSAGVPRFELAYEPVWAIGTGETATPEMAQEAHDHLRQHLQQHLGQRAAEIRILYGGSANPGNVAELYAQQDIDGFLVGGASLDVDKFLDMIRVCDSRR